MAKRNGNLAHRQQTEIELISTLNTGESFDPENPSTSLFKFTIALTKSVWDQCLKIPARVGGEDFERALWNVLWALKIAVERSSGESVLTYSIHVRLKNRQAKLITLKARCGSFATGVPIIKITTPAEDRIACRARN